MTRSMLLVMLAALAPALGAQQASPRPDTLAAPRLIQGSMFDVLLLSHASAQALSDPASFGAYVRACSPRVGLTTSDSASLMSTRNWGWESGSSAEHGVLTILVARRISAEIDCQAGAAPRIAALARGFATSADTSVTYLPALVEVVARRGRTPIEALELERIESTRLTRSGNRPIPAGIVRLALPFEALAPDSSGVVRDFAIEVLGGEMAARQVIVIPWSDLAAIWEQALPARAGAAGAAAPVAFEDWVTVASRAATRGDVPAARIAFAHALQMEPCLSLSASAEASARAVLAPMQRPTARCEASVLRTVARSAILPGFGQPSRGSRRVVAGVVLGSVAATLLLSHSANTEARDLYDRYLALDGPSPIVAALQAQRLYERAEARRVAGTDFAVAAAAIWGVSLLQATVSEYLLERRLARVQGVTPGARTATLRPFVSPRGVGVALSVGGGSAR